MDALQKPFSRKEYLQLFDMASIRTPLVKLRQVRKDAKFYSTDELGNSYFDHYPGMFLYHVYTLSDKYCVICLDLFFTAFCTLTFQKFVSYCYRNWASKLCDLYLLHFMNSLTTFWCVVSTIIIAWVILECWNSSAVCAIHHCLCMC
jgi:hypothetical protein